MPDPALLTDLGELHRSWLPVALRDSPDHLAVIHPIAKEIERLEATVETVRAQFFPQTADILLKAWEAELGITIEPVGVSVADRRDIVIAFLRKLRSTPSGSDWVADITELVGSGWSYEEHIPGDAGSPPENTIRIHLPFAPSSTLYARTERLIREITPAHLDLILAFTGGFLLDQSQLDQETLQ